MLKGRLTEPNGDGPFPTIVLLHACRGITAYSEVWVERLVKWGYLVLQVDSFGPRGLTDECGGGRPRISREERIEDAYAARSYLMGLHFVDSNRIGVMGWSYGGGTVLSAVSRPIGDKRRENYFKMGIAFYPSCREERASLESPLLILIGSRDDWTPADSCEAMKKFWSKKGAKNELILKIYPGAYHGFDAEGLDETYRGHRMKYDPNAASDAIMQVKDFFEKHLQ
jgi:dienelactone hydrolase